MIVTEAVWDRIRDQFSADEKATLRSVITGHVICPPAIAIDATKLDAGLAAKLTKLIAAREFPRCI